MKASLYQLLSLTTIFILFTISISARAGFFGPFNGVPEPSVISLLGLGLAAGLLVHHMNKRKGKK